MGDTEGGTTTPLEASMEDLFAEAVKSVERHSKKVGPIDELAIGSSDDAGIMIVDLDSHDFEAAITEEGETNHQGASQNRDDELADLEEALVTLRLDHEGTLEELEGAKKALKQQALELKSQNQRFEELQRLGRKQVADAQKQAEQLEHLKHQVDLRNSEMKRLAATLKRGSEQVEGLRRRHAREKQELQRYGSEKPFRELLSVLDNLERALQHQDASPDALKEGVQMTLSQFYGAFASYGVKAIPCDKGSAFDPSQQEAMLQVASNDVPPGSVYEVMQSGYTYHERLLRPARVTVARPDTTQEPVISPESKLSRTDGSDPSTLEQRVTVHSELTPSLETPDSASDADVETTKIEIPKAGKASPDTAALAQDE